MGSYHECHMALCEELSRNISFTRDLSVAYQKTKEGGQSDSDGLYKALSKSHRQCHETLDKLMKSFLEPDKEDKDDTDSANIPEHVKENNAFWEKIVRLTSGRGSTERQIFDSPKKNVDNRTQKYQSIDIPLLNTEKQNFGGPKRNVNDKKKKYQSLDIQLLNTEKQIFGGPKRKVDFKNQYYQSFDIEMPITEKQNFGGPKRNVDDKTKQYYESFDIEMPITEEQNFGGPKINVDYKKQYYESFDIEIPPAQTLFHSPSKNFVQSSSGNQFPPETLNGPQRNVINKSPSKSQMQPRYAAKKHGSTSETRNKSAHASRNQYPCRSLDVSPNTNRKRSPRRSRHPYKRYAPYKDQNSSWHKHFYSNSYKYKNHRPRMSSSPHKFETQQWSPSWRDQEERNRKITRSIGRKLSKFRKNDIPPLPETSETLLKEDDMDMEKAKDIEDNSTVCNETKKDDFIVPAPPLLQSAPLTSYQEPSQFYQQTLSNFSSSLYYTQNQNLVSPQPPGPYLMHPRFSLIQYPSYLKPYYTPNNNML